MVKVLYFVLKTVRPRQWLKNTALFAALVFSGQLFEPGNLWLVSKAFGLFCLLSSAVYIINDISDVEQDRKHPFKKKRPIAAGDLPIPFAWVVAAGLLLIVLVVGFKLSFFFFLLSIIYLLINLTYTSHLKTVPILDIITIAAGYVIRVYAGALVVNLHLNAWFLLTVISLSLFLAVGKRQSERTLLQGGGLLGHRVTLSAYSTRLLDIYTGMFANATWFTYALFAFQHQFEKVNGPIPTFFAMMPRTFMAQKWLMITVPMVIYGVMRYLQLVYEKNEGESPAKVITSDIPLLTAVVIWLVAVIGILYGIG